MLSSQQRPRLLPQLLPGSAQRQGRHHRMHSSSSSRGHQRLHPTPQLLQKSAPRERNNRKMLSSNSSSQQRRRPILQLLRGPASRKLSNKVLRSKPRSSSKPLSSSSRHQHSRPSPRLLRVPAPPESSEKRLHPLPTRRLSPSTGTSTTRSWLTRNRKRPASVGSAAHRHRHTIGKHLFLDQQRVQLLTSP